MSSAVLDDRRKALEDAFFKKEGEKLKAKLQESREREAIKKALAESAGIRDEDLLERLCDLKISAETVAALSLVPLVEVAWADGKMDRQEIEAILRAAEESGVKPGSPAYELLDLWTKEPPGPSLIEAWREYIGAVCAELSAEQRWRLEESVVGRAQAVAAAAGGFLGIGKISSEETQVLEALHAPFKV